MAKFPALRIWTDALLGDTFHLTPAEFGAYMRLLIVEWRTADCSLPNDDVFLGRSIGDPKNWHRLKPRIIGFFKLGDDNRYRQLRLLDEWDSCSRWAARSAAGNAAKALKRNNRDSSKDVLNSAKEHPPIPIPNEEESKKVLNFVVGKKEGGNGNFIQDPGERLNRFMKTLAEAIGRDGYMIVGQASDPEHPLYGRSVAICKDVAKQLGKGWPHRWPKGAQNGVP